MIAVALGTLAGWATFAAAAAAAYAFWRGGGSTAIASLEAANRVLEKRVKDLEDQRRQDEATISELRGRTDVSEALAPILEWTVKHETRAQERHETTLEGHEKTLVILDLIAERLGPDKNGHNGEEI